MLLTMIISMAVVVFTQTAKKIKVPSKYVAVFLSLVLGGAYFVLCKYLPGLIEATWENVVVIYGFANVIYMFLNEMGFLKSQSEILDKK